MKSKKRNWKKIILVVVMFILILISLKFTLAINTPAEGFNLNRSTNLQQIWAAGLCYEVKNTQTALDYFVPTKTSTEYLAFIAHTPSGATATACSSFPPRTVLWGGKIAKHTNSTGVWVDDSDCSTSWPSSNITYCSEWNTDVYSANSSYGMEVVFNWKTSGCVGDYYSVKQTIECKRCPDLNDEYSCTTVGCLWHSYGMDCGIGYCNSYYSQATCEEVGCYWNSYCYGAYYCDQLATITECLGDEAFSEPMCGWDGYNLCCYDAGEAMCPNWNGLGFQCEAQGCMYDWNTDVCHEQCPVGT